MNEPRYEQWAQWQTRFDLASARELLAGYQIRQPMDRLLGRPEILGATEDVMVVFVELLRAPNHVGVRVPLWQVWDIPDLMRVVAGLVVYAAAHEASEMLELDGELAWDPHDWPGDVVPFALVMHAAGARYWSSAPHWSRS